MQEIFKKYNIEKFKENIEKLQIGKLQKLLQKLKCSLIVMGIVGVIVLLCGYLIIGISMIAIITVVGIIIENIKNRIEVLRLLDKMFKIDYLHNNIISMKLHISEIVISEKHRCILSKRLDNEIILVRTLEGFEFICDSIPTTKQHKKVDIPVIIKCYADSQVIHSIEVIRNI